MVIPSLALCFRRRRRCGARRKRDGQPCRAPALANGRCKYHGGLSTGSRTAAGRARIAAAQRQRWARWRAARAGPSGLTPDLGSTVPAAGAAIAPALP